MSKRMSKFMIGDIVVGLGRHDEVYDYSFTHRGSICEVVKIISDERIIVKLLKSRVSQEVGKTFNVEEQYFSLAVEGQKYEGMSPVVRKIHMIYDKQRSKGIQI